MNRCTNQNPHKGWASPGTNPACSSVPTLRCEEPGLLGLTWRSCSGFGAFHPFVYQRPSSAPAAAGTPRAFLVNFCLPGGRCCQKAKVRDVLCPWCRIVSDIPGLHPLEASSTLSSSCDATVTAHRQQCTDAWALAVSLRQSSLSTPTYVPGHSLPCPPQLVGSILT